MKTSSPSPSPTHDLPLKRFNWKPVASDYCHSRDAPVTPFDVSVHHHQLFLMRWKERAGIISTGSRFIGRPPPSLAGDTTSLPSPRRPRRKLSFRIPLVPSLFSSFPSSLLLLFLFSLALALQSSQPRKPL